MVMLSLVKRPNTNSYDANIAPDIYIHDALRQRTAVVNDEQWMNRRRGFTNELPPRQMPLWGEIHHD